MQQAHVSCRHQQFSGLCVYRIEQVPVGSGCCAACANHHESVCLFQFLYKILLGGFDWSPLTTPDHHHQRPVWAGAWWPAWPLITISSTFCIRWSSEWVGEQSYSVVTSVKPLSGLLLKTEVQSDWLVCLYWPIALKDSYISLFHSVVSRFCTHGIKLSIEYICNKNTVVYDYCIFTARQHSLLCRALY